MANKSAFLMDASAFIKGLHEVCEKAIPAKAKKGLWDAGNQIHNDCDTIEPKSPHDEGTLRGAWESVAVVDGSHFILEVGHNEPYAVYLHEMVTVGETPDTWSEPGSGPKWLEDKVVRFWKKYLEIIAENCRI
jgi:hypothetical protein